MVAKGQQARFVVEVSQSPVFGFSRVISTSRKGELCTRKEVSIA